MKTRAFIVAIVLVAHAPELAFAAGRGELGETGDPVRRPAVSCGRGDEPDGGAPEPNPDPSEKCIGSKANLSAKPTKIKLGESVTLGWSVAAPFECSLTELRLSGQGLDPNGQTVAAIGTTTVQPTYTQIYRFHIRSSEIGRVQVEVERQVFEIKNGPNARRDFLKAVDTPSAIVRLEKGLELDLTGEQGIVIREGVTITSEVGALKPPIGVNPGRMHGSIAARPVTAERPSTDPKPAPASVIVAARDARNLGPRIFYNGLATNIRPRPLFQIAGVANVRLFGFRLHGPNPGVADGDKNTEEAIKISGSKGIEIANIEFAGWSGEAIQIERNADTFADETGPQIVHIHDNFLHHNQHVGTRGYGIHFSTGGYATIERNVFDFNRHAIATANNNKGVSYDAYYNLVLKGGGFHKRYVPQVGATTAHTHQFDVHGDDNCGIKTVPVFGSDHVWNCGNAGERFNFSYNSFQYAKESSIEIRGKPRNHAFIRHNVFATSRGDAIDFGHGGVTVSDNTFSVDTYGQYGVCDFEGDRRDDLFLPTGTSWWYSSFGKMHWVFLNAAAERIHQLGLGDFDGDGRCDVFTVHANDAWVMSRGGTGTWEAVGSFGVPFDQLAFADFDGDGSTDVFRRAPNGQWSVYSVKTKQWMQGSADPLPLKKLRFGHFTNDRKADVLSLANASWSISEGGTGEWTRLNSKRSDKIESFVIADVRGDGRDDVLVPDGMEWRISDDGKTELKKLSIGGKDKRAVTVLKPAPRWFWGRFDEKPGADALLLDHGRNGWIASNGQGELRPFGAYER